MVGLPQRRFILAVALLAIGLYTPALAERYLIQVGDLSPTYVGDANEYLTRLEPVSGFAPPTAASLATLQAPAVPPGAAPTVQANLDPGAARISTAAPPRVPGNPTDLEEYLAPVPMPPDPAFVAQLASIYGVTLQNEVDAIWAWCTKESATLGLGERTGNSVIRYIVAIDRPLTQDATARPDLLKPEATRGTVRTTIGVAVRGSPWGPSGGPPIPSGTAVTVIPPADGPWYQVQTANGTGWVSGLWLDLE